MVNSLVCIVLPWFMIWFLIIVIIVLGIYILVNLSFVGFRVPGSGFSLRLLYIEKIKIIIIIICIIYIYSGRDHF